MRRKSYPVNGKVERMGNDGDDKAATFRVIRAKGLAAASTREIAREAGCADGTLYNHFVDRADLFVAIFLEKLLPDYSDALSKLPYRIGEGTVQAHLEELAQIVFAFYLLQSCPDESGSVCTGAT